MSKLATSVGQLESQGKLPWQMKINRKHNVSALSLRSGKIYEVWSRSKQMEEAEKESEEILDDREAEKVEEKETARPVKPIWK